MNITKARGELLSGKTIYDMKLKVADYGRVSTDKDDQLNSLENQVNYFADLIKSNPNWTHVDSYIDEGISGTSAEKRENFLRMIEDAENGKIDLILTKEVSRFARNTIDSIKYTERLLKNGVIVLFISDNINTIYPDSEFRLTIMASMAQDEVRKLSERVKFGIKRSIKDGKVGGSHITGYIKNAGKLIINPKEAPIVTKIFNLYASGCYSLSQISKELSKDGYYTKKGKPYSLTTLKNILTNPRYKGYYTANLTRVVDYKTHKKEKIPPMDQIIYKEQKGYIPAIVTENIWDKANKIYESRKKHWNKINLNKEKYITKRTYTSKLICKEHNKPFIRAASSKRKENPVWQCNEYLRHGKNACLSPLIKESVLDNLFCNIINEILDLTPLKEELLDLYMKCPVLENTTLEQQITTHEQIKSNLITLLSRSLITPEEYLKEKSNIEKTINKLNSQRSNTKNLEKIRNYLKNNCTIKADIREYVNIFIDEVLIQKLNNDRKHLSLTIIYNYEKSTKETELFLNNK